MSSDDEDWGDGGNYDNDGVYDYDDDDEEEVIRTLGVYDKDDEIEILKTQISGLTLQVSALMKRVKHLELNGSDPVDDVPPHLDLTQLEWRYNGEGHMFGYRANGVLAWVKEGYPDDDEDDDDYPGTLMAEILEQQDCLYEE